MKDVVIKVNDSDIDRIVIAEMKDVYKNCVLNLTRMGALAILDYYMTAYDFEQWSKENE